MLDDGCVIVSPRATRAHNLAQPNSQQPEIIKIRKHQTMRRPSTNLRLLSPLLATAAISAFAPPPTHHSMLCTSRASLLPTSHYHTASSSALSTSRLSSTPSTQPRPLATSGDWSAYLDETKGLIYYFNRRTGESTWDPPLDVDLKVELNGETKKVMRERLRDYLEERLGQTFLEESDALLGEQKVVVTKNSSTSKKEMTVLSTSKSAQEILADKRRSGILATQGPWIALIDEKRGMIYYHDEATNTTTWNRPDSFPFIKLSAAKRKELQEQNKRYLEWRTGNVKKVNVLGKGTVTARIGSELDTLDKIQSDIDERLEEAVDPKPKEAIYKDDIWAAYLDDNSGLVYYFNMVEKKSVWDPPSDDYLEMVKMNMMGGVVTLDLSQADAQVNDGTDAKEQVVANTKISDKPSTNPTNSIEEESLARCSIDYDAAVRLAYGESGTKENFTAFKTKYLLENSNMVASKHKSRMTQNNLQNEVHLARSPIDYDAAARLSFISSGSDQGFDEFKAQYLVDTSTMVAKKFKDRVEAMKSKVDEVKEIKQAAEQGSSPFFLADDQNGTRINPSEPNEPQLPENDPFISESNVVSLISPLQTRTLYDILQCDMSATRSEIKRSYITLAKETHPDALLQNGVLNDKEAEKKFNEIARAYKILSDPTERRRYNRELKAKGMSKSAGSVFENWVMGAAKVIDEALTKAERDLT